MIERPLTVVVTGTVEDRLNTNTAIRRYVAQGFRDLGSQHVVVKEIGYESLTGPAGRHDADLVLAVGGVAVDASNLRALRRFADRAGAVLAFWLHDDPYEFDYAFRLRGIADMVFNTDRWAAMHYGDVPAAHLPLAGCPHTHLRAVDAAAPRDLALFFCGYAYQNRIDFLREGASLLRRHRTYVSGDRWPQDLPFAHNERMSPAAFADTAARARLTLNIGRDLSIANARFNLAPSTPGPRTFEVALMGSAQLFVAESLEVLEYFERDREIILVDGVRDLELWLERAQDEPGAILDIAARAQRRALAEHTYQHRAETALAELRLLGVLPRRTAAPDQAPVFAVAAE
ncbi:MAG: glycosyltransferase [Methylobacterium frigidaeris]